MMPYFDHPRRGASLLETLIASALLMTIALAVFPMFHRAVTNNTSGNESTQATQHGRTEVEGLLALPLRNQVFDMKNPVMGHVVQPDTVNGGDEMLLMGTFYWDPEANTTTLSTDLTRHIAPGAWIDDVTAATGLVVWERESKVRHYSYSDISDGVIDAGGGTRFTVGHPELFDEPLSQNSEVTERNFVEQDVTLNSRRVGTPSFRTRLWRSM